MQRKRWMEWGAWGFALVLLGWGLPRLLGVVYSDAILSLTYAGLTILFAAPAVVDRVFADRGRSLTTAQLWRHIAMGTGFGLVSFLLLLIIVDVMMRWRTGGQLSYDYLANWRLALLAAACSAFGSGLAAAVTVKTQSLKQARLALRFAFLLALLLSVYGLRRLSDDTRFELMAMAQAGSEWRMFLIVAGGLLAAGMGLALFASRDERYHFTD